MVQVNKCGWHNFVNLINITASTNTLKSGPEYALWIVYISADTLVITADISFIPNIFCIKTCSVIISTEQMILNGYMCLIDFAEWLIIVLLFWTWSCRGNTCYANTCPLHILHWISIGYWYIDMTYWYSCKRLSSHVQITMSPSLEVQRQGWWGDSG